MTTPLILAEHQAWNSYEAYAVRRNRNGHVENFTGDEASHNLWRIWKAAYEARREAASTFYRRPDRRRWA